MLGKVSLQLLKSQMIMETNFIAGENLFLFKFSGGLFILNNTEEICG